MDDGFDFEDTLEEQQNTAQQQQVGGHYASNTQSQHLHQQQMQAAPSRQAHQLPQQKHLMLQHQQQQPQHHQQQMHLQQQQPPQDQQHSSIQPLQGHPQQGIEPWRQQSRPPEKKTVCVYWLKNTCHRGDKCGFLHVMDETRMPLCPNVKKHGVCSDPECKFKHDLDDLKDCNMYRLGFCVYGPNCRYRHNPLPGPPPPPETVEAARPRPSQRFGQDFNTFNRGRGRFQPYAGPGRGMRPFQVHPPMQNGNQIVPAPTAHGQPIQ